MMDALQKLGAGYDGCFSEGGFQYAWVAAMSVGL